MPNDPVTMMYGPYFLILYGSVIAVTLLLCRHVMRRSDPTISMPPLALPDKPDPFEISYIRGGVSAVTKLIVFDLYQRGYLQSDHASHSTATSPRLFQAPDRCEADTVGRLSPLERPVFDWFSEPRFGSYLRGVEVPPALTGLCDDYEQHMRNEKLRMPVEAEHVARRARIGGAMVIAGLGGYRLSASPAIGSAEILFLLILGVLGLSAVYLVTRHQPDRLSHRGEDYLERLERTHESLRSKRIEEVDHATARLAVALFGFSRLAGTPFAPVARMFAPRAAGTPVTPVTMTADGQVGSGAAAGMFGRGDGGTGGNGGGGGGNGGR